MRNLPEAAAFGADFDVVESAMLDSMLDGAGGVGQYSRNQPSVELIRGRLRIAD